jgi:hypothetical protein
LAIAAVLEIKFSESMRRGRTHMARCQANRCLIWATALHPEVLLHRRKSHLPGAPSLLFTFLG